MITHPSAEAPRASSARLGSLPTLALMLAALSAVSGCSETRRALGIEKAPPDEFAVVANAPLSQPPDYSLRPPIPGAPRPQEGTTQDRAREALTGQLAGTAAPTPPSSAELVLLAKAGTSNNIPDIRHKVDEETTGFATASGSWVDWIMFWKPEPISGDPINATREAQRLKDNKAAGKPANQGEIYISRTEPSASESKSGGWFSWMWPF